MSLPVVNPPSTLDTFINVRSIINLEEYAERASRFISRLPVQSDQFFEDCKNKALEDILRIQATIQHIKQTKGIH